MVNVIYKENGITLSVGDKMRYDAPKEGDSFYGSKLGKPFAEGKCDTAYLEVVQQEWLEVIFVLTLELKGQVVTNWDILKKSPDEKMPEFDMDNFDDQHRYQHCIEPFTETADYNFMRHFLRIGAQVLK